MIRRRTYAFFFVSFRQKFLSLTIINDLEVNFTVYTNWKIQISDLEQNLIF